MTQQITQLAVLNIASAGTEAALLMLKEAYVQVERALKQLEHSPARDKLEQAYFTIHQTIRILGLTSAITHQEFRTRAADLPASEAERQTGHLAIG